MKDAWKELKTLLRAMIRVFPSECRKFVTETREGRALHGMVLLAGIAILWELVWSLCVWVYSLLAR
jgi:hypothetical protein